MNNLRKFTNEAEYTAATLNYPAVSWVTATDVVHFDKTALAAFSGLTVYYNITDISQPTVLFNGGGSGSGSGSGSGVLPSAMIIDDTAVEVTNTYQFSTTGEHIVNYSFADNQIQEHFLDDGSTGKFSTVAKVEIGDAITSIGERAFQACSGITNVTIGGGAVGNYAFYQCTNLTSVTIANGVTSIGTQAFVYCNNLTSVVVPDSVTSIGNYALSVPNLTSCVIGSGITSIGEGVFEDCENLYPIGVTIYATTPPTLGFDAFTGTRGCPILVPSQSVNAYKTASNWSTYASRIQAIP